MNDKLFLIIFFLISLGIGLYYLYIDPIYYINLKLFLKNTPSYFIPTLLISLLALYVTTQNYLRKSGNIVLATIITRGNFACKQSYISSIILVNKKDKPLVINDLYIKFGNNIFVELTFEEEETIILKSYEAFEYKFEPHLTYITSNNQVTNITNAIEDVNIKKTVVLDTLEGIIECKALIFKKVINEVLSNNNCFLITRRKGKFINEIPVGDNVLYLIEFTKNNHEKSFLYISSQVEEKLLDGKLNFEKELLLSNQGKNHIEEIIKNAINEKTINWLDFNVHSQFEELDYIKKVTSDEIISLTNKSYYRGWFNYNIISRLTSYFEKISIKRKNNKKG